MIIETIKEIQIETMFKRMRDRRIGQHYDEERNLMILTQLISHFSEVQRIIYEFSKEVQDYVDFNSG